MAGIEVAQGEGMTEVAACKASFLKRLVMRVRASFRTNEPQATSVLLFSAFMLLACARRSDVPPLWLWVVCGLFWPLLAWVHNLFNPLPE